MLEDTIDSKNCCKMRKNPMINFSRDQVYATLSYLLYFINVALNEFYVLVLKQTQV